MKHRSIAIALICAVALKLAGPLISVLKEAQLNTTGFAFSVGDALAYWLRQPLTILWLAVLVGAGRSAFGRRVDEASAAKAAVITLPMGRFLLIWIAAAASIGAGSVALGWLGFAVWFSPWYWVRWPT